MNKDIGFSKSKYKWISNTLYLFGVVPLLFVIYGVEKGIIDSGNEMFYLSMICSVFFIVDFIFGLIVGEMTAGVMVVKKNKNPIVFFIRLMFSVTFALLCLIVALNS